MTSVTGYAQEGMRKYLWATMWAACPEGILRTVAVVFLCWIGFLTPFTFPTTNALAESSLPIVNAGGFFNIRLPSYQESKFQRVVPQGQDFSCGSAAIATILTYHYDRPTTEEEVLDEMMLFGDTERILTQGFSMGDMKEYLERHGFQSGGFQAPLDVLLKAGIPGIVLINTKGFLHFVVIKGIVDDYVLVGDPALGIGIKKRSEFEKIWTGVIFVVTDHDTEGRKYFNDENEWSSWWVLPQSPNALALNMRQDLSSFLLTLPNPVTNFTVVPGGPTIIERLF